jgi:hypothetical protein
MMPTGETVEFAIGLALAFFFVGGVTLFGKASSRKARNALLGVPERRVDDARDGERVVLRGVALPTLEGPVASPCTGARVVWWRVQVQARAPAARTITRVPVQTPAWTTVYEETAGRDLVVQEPGGGRARVAMDDAIVRVRDVTTTSDTTAIVEFLKGAGVRAPRRTEEQDVPDFHRLASIPGTAARMVEEWIVEGAELSVLGTAHREASAPGPDAYRRADQETLLVDGGEGEEGLIVTTEDIRALAREAVSG